MIKYALKDLHPVGMLYKSTGVKGHLICDFEDYLIDHLDKLSYLFVEHRGQSRPLFVEEIIDNGEFLIKFESIDNPEDATQWSQSKIYLDIDFLDSLDIEKGHHLPSLIGYHVKNKGAVVGPIVDILDYPSQQMIVVDYSSKEVMIPAVPEWILNIEEETRELLMDFDEEILDL